MTGSSEEVVEQVATAIMERRIKPDWRQVVDGHWVIDHDKELAIAAIEAYEAALSTRAQEEAQRD